MYMIKRMCCMIVCFVCVFVNTVVIADRNEDRRKQEAEQNTQAVETPADLPARFAKKLDGYLLIKTENEVIFASGKGRKVDAPAFYENGNIYVPAAAAASFFGAAAEWDPATGTVKIGDTMIYPSDSTKMVNDRTMMAAQDFAYAVDAKVIYSDADTVIFGRETLDASVVSEVIASLRDKFYVVPDTSVIGDGTLEKPYGGMQAAIAGIREFTAAGMNSNITVYLRGGLYVNREVIRFSPEDSGKNGYTITYRSYPGEKAELVAADTVDNWVEYKDGIYVADVDPVNTINVVFENDIFARKARYPNVEDEDNFWKYYLHSAGYNKNKPNEFYFHDKDLPYINDATGLQAVLFGGGDDGHINWWMEQYNGQIDFRKKSITLSTAPARTMGAGSRYYIQGCLELLDEEGEFYYDETAKKIYYKPFNKNINEQSITYATVYNPIFLDGSASKHVKNIIFDDLKIGKSNCTTEMKVASEPGIYFLYAENCAIRNCEISGIGLNGINLNNSKKCDISGNYIHDIGGFGIMSEAEDCKGETVYTGTTIYNNYIENVGILKREASGINLRQTDCGTVMNNYINGAPRMGILFGSDLQACTQIGQNYRGQEVTVDNQFEFRNGRLNTIAFNEVTNVMTDSQDGGAIYTWGAGAGNVVSNNYVHDVIMNKISTIPMMFVYYNDDSSGYVTYANNIAAANQLEGGGNMLAAMFTKSVGHTIINNFLVNNPQTIEGAYSTYTDLEDPGNNVTYRNNLTMNSGDRIHGQYKWKSDRFKLCDYNLYYNDSGKYLIYRNNLARTYDEWKKVNTDNGYMDHNSISEKNPNFMDYDNRDYRLRYDSPAYSIGIHDINERDIGVTRDFRFADPEDELEKLYPETSTDGLSASVRINSGETAQISLTARTAKRFFANLNNAKITFESLDESVATVSETGRISGVGTGIAEIRITAEKNGKTVTSNLYVLVNDVFKSLTAKLASNVMDKGDSTTVMAVGSSSMGFAIPLSDVTYKSSNEKVAVVDAEGKVTAVSPGSATITVNGSYKGITKTASAEIKVLNGVLKEITLKAEKQDAILIGEQIQLDYDAVLTTGEPVSHDSVNAVYSSGDETVMKIDENGLMTAVGEGRTRITLMLEKDGLGKTQDLEVSVFEKNTGKLDDGFKEINFGTSYGYSDFKDDGTILIRSTGDDFYDEADDGYYLYKEINNEDVTLEVNIQALLETSSNTALGLTIRESAEPDSKNYTIRALADGRVISVWRTEKGGKCSYTSHGSGNFPIKLKIEKKGSFIKSFIDFGGGYQEAYSMNLDMNTGYTAGLPLFSQSVMSTEAIISGLSIQE